MSRRRLAAYGCLLIAFSLAIPVASSPEPLDGLVPVKAPVVHSSNLEFLSDDELTKYIAIRVGHLSHDERLALARNLSDDGPSTIQLGSTAPDLKTENSHPATHRHLLIPAALALSATAIALVAINGQRHQAAQNRQLEDEVAAFHARGSRMALPLDASAVTLSPPSVQNSPGTHATYCGIAEALDSGETAAQPQASDSIYQDSLQTFLQVAVDVAGCTAAAPTTASTTAITGTATTGAAVTRMQAATGAMPTQILKVESPHQLAECTTTNDLTGFYNRHVGTFLHLVVPTPSPSPKPADIASASAAVSKSQDEIKQVLSAVASAASPTATPLPPLIRTVYSFVAFAPGVALPAAFNCNSQKPSVVQTSQP